MDGTYFAPPVGQAAEPLPRCTGTRRASSSNTATGSRRPPSASRYWRSVETPPSSSPRQRCRAQGPLVDLAQPRVVMFSSEPDSGFTRQQCCARWTVDVRASLGGAQPSDSELLSRVAERDPDASRTLHGRHAPWILARLRRRCFDDDVVFDALQDTFVAVWRNAESWSGAGDPAARLWGIASRRLIGVQRLRTRWVPASTSLDLADPSDQEGAVVERLRLDEEVGSLDPDLRDAVMVTYVEGLSVAEASTVLAIPTGTVKRLMRAKAIERRARLNAPVTNSTPASPSREAGQRSLIPATAPHSRSMARVMDRRHAECMGTDSRFSAAGSSPTFVWSCPGAWLIPTPFAAAVAGTRHRRGVR